MRRRVRRVLAGVDADAVQDKAVKAVKAAKARLDRFVLAYPAQVAGLTSWAACLPAAESAACWAGIDELAHQMRGHDPTRTLGQCRADALVDLLLSNVNVTTTVTLMIPVQTITTDEPDGSLERDLLACDLLASDVLACDLLASDVLACDLLARGNQCDPGCGSGAGTAATGKGVGEGFSQHGQGRGGVGLVGLLDTRLLDPRLLDPLAGWDEFGQPTPDPNPLNPPTWAQVCAMGYQIPGIGVIGGDVVAAILERFDTQITRVLLDEHSGTVIESGTSTYRPSPRIRRFIQQRDGHCRFPGCQRAATRCEPDHIIPFSRGGPTTVWNLVSVCKHHHRIKHNTSWELTMTRDGTCTWTDPHGRQYATHPTNHHQMAA